MQRLSLRERLHHLSTLLKAATDFGVPWRYFHDELAMQRDFIDASRSGYDAMLLETLSAAAARALGRSIVVHETLMMHIADEGVRHGTITFEATMGAFFVDER